MSAEGLNVTQELPDLTIPSAVRAAREQEAARAAAKPDGTSEETKDGDLFIWFRAKRYQVGIPNKACYDACRARYQSRQIDPLEALGQALEKLEKRDDLKPKVLEDMRRRFTDKAYADLLTPAEDRVPDDAQLANWINQAAAGKKFMWFQLLALHSPDMTEELAQEIADAGNKAGYLELVEKVRQQLKKKIAKEQ